MANWCYSRVWIETDAGSARRLYDALEAAMSKEYDASICAPNWVGKLLISTGVSVEDAKDVKKCKVDCLCFVEHYELNAGSEFFGDSGEVKIELCSAGRPLFGALKRFLDYVLDGAFYLVEYEAEEDGCGAYYANGATSGTWRIDYCGYDEAFAKFQQTCSFWDDDVVLEGLEKLLGKTGKLEDLMQEASERAEQDDGCLEFHKYEFVDWLDFT